MNLGAQKGWLATVDMRLIDISLTAMGSFMLQSVVLSDDGKSAFPVVLLVSLRHNGGI
jgi:hypothetical protein